ncbi:hypothetical protein GEMRC1_009225 [Eukaryota sp. GEM-RC1]
MSSKSAIIKVSNSLMDGDNEGVYLYIEVEIVTLN